jgi:L-ascorbate metabolism protein UlaG (beta-lactamase superfamily)
LKLTKYGHCCLLIENGSDRILVDPGTFSSGWDGLTALTAVLITHQHPDHLDQARLPGLLALNSDVQLFADPGSVEALRTGAGISATAVHAGDTLDLATPVEVLGERHAVIHAELPEIPNRRYLIAGRLLVPGDSLEVPTEAVEILAVPVGAPWMALKEAVEFVRGVDPSTLIPIHEKVLATTTTVYSLLQKLKPADTEWLDLDDGRTVDI